MYICHLSYLLITNNFFLLKCLTQLIITKYNTECYDLVILRKAVVVWKKKIKRRRTSKYDLSSAGPNLMYSPPWI